MNTYKIIRFYQGSNPSKVIESGLTLEEAQRHCGDPETLSSTAASEQAKEHTKKHGNWFDGYEKE